MNLREDNKVSILKLKSLIINTRYKSRVVIADGCNYSSMGFLSINIKNSKLRPKITKHSTKKASNFSLNKSNRRLMTVAVIIELDSFLKADFGKNNGLQKSEIKQM
jgi:hypothetical protein